MLDALNPVQVQIECRESHWSGRMQGVDEALMRGKEALEDCMEKSLLCLRLVGFSMVGVVMYDLVWSSSSSHGGVWMVPDSFSLAPASSSRWVVVWSFGMPVVSLWVASVNASLLASNLSFGDLHCLL
eukprot:Gb_13548 [translate_table: standard]